jgi:hypothetical protein
MFAHARAVANLEHRHFGKQEGAEVEHRPQRCAADAERNDPGRMRMDDGFDVRPRLVNLAMDKALEKACTPLRIDGIGIEVVFHDVVCRDQRRS